MTNTQKPLGELVADVLAAELKCVDADTRYTEARRYQTECLNALNVAQAAVDARLAEVRKASHTSSDWGRPIGKPTSE